MGAQKSGKSRTRKFLEEEDEMVGAVTVLTSSDDEEANRDLSLDIVERARRREAKRTRTVVGLEKELVVTDTAGGGGDSGGGAEEGVVPVLVPLEKTRKRKKGDKKKKTKKEKMVEEEVKVVDAALQEEGPIGTTDSVVTEVNEASDNAVLRKLLRGPRYFDSESCNWQSCYNCGEEGHIAANCTAERRQKPCFVCGMFGHIARHCTQGQDCFICKRRGHVAKDCPDKHQKNAQNSKMCLRCGDLGHEMSLCTSGYAPEDLKEIKCYVCKKFGHLCCLDFTDTGPREISCYNCGLTGHSGVGCAKPRWQTSGGADSPTLCYICGEEGHFARGCTKKAKPDRKIGEASTPAPKHKRNRDFAGSRSAPHDFGKSHKKKSMKYDERSMTASKSRIKGGWIVDDPGDVPRRKYKGYGWVSPSTPANRGRKSSTLSGSVGYPSSQSPHKRKSFPRTPSSSGSASQYKPASRASRYDDSGGYLRRR